MADGSIVVAGAGTKIGTQLAFRIAAEGVAQRLMVADSAHVPYLPGGAPLPEVETLVVGSELQFTNMLDGARALVVTTSQAPGLDLVELIHTAAAQNIRIIHVSHIGAHEQAVSSIARRQWQVEQAVRESGVAWTIVQASVQFADLIRAVRHNVLAAPVGEARVAAVSHADVADAVIAVLLDERQHAHDGVTYQITGPEALTGGQVAEALSAATQRDIQYHWEDASAENPPSAGNDDIWASCCAAIADGVFDQVDDSISNLAGRPARSFAQWLADYPAEWSRLVQ